jgi:hypothetical protein
MYSCTCSCVPSGERFAGVLAGGAAGVLGNQISSTYYLPPALHTANSTIEQKKRI